MPQVCHRHCPPEHGAGRLLAAVAAVVVTSVAAAWAWEIAVIAGVGGLLVAAACCIGIQAGKRRMVLAWPERQPEALSAPVRVPVAAPVRSPRPVAGSPGAPGVATRIIRAEVER